MIGNVVWTLADRPHYTRQTLEYWRKVRGVEKWNHTFFIEPGMSTDEQIAVVLEKPFPRQQIVLNPVRMGVLRCAWNALETGFTGHPLNGMPPADFCVLAEEDLAVSDDVLELFDRLSTNFYGTQCGAICMSGYSTTAEASFADFVCDPDKFDSHIWGTWRNVWERTLRDTWDFDYSSGDPSGWDWNIALRVFPQNRMYSVHPKISRSDNLGQYGGVHQNPAEYEASRPPQFEAHVPPMILSVEGPCSQEET